MKDDKESQADERAVAPSYFDGERHFSEVAVNRRCGASTKSPIVPEERRASVNENKEILIPFLKWPGGKRWFVDKHADLIPNKLTGRYIEPFLGGGAMFFAINPREAILSDLCSDLLCVYRGIRNQRHAVAQLLKQHAVNHSREYYYQVRESEPDLIAERAARLLYLNRTCFNGIYRVNQAGKFNVPLGSKTSVIREEDNFAGWSAALRRAELKHSDFESVIDDARKGDFIFADPPYTVRHNDNGFIKYNEVLFSWDDQLRLHECLQRAKARKVHILMTNANHESLRALYKKGFQLSIVSRFSSIAASSKNRNRYEELVVRA
ncbi:Dam family site-specific DNA-(adenine-N6)-methyltransferase [Paraburkholderia sediminicola]|uniref:DNA adenine methylase n=1 Tax=Paraburkholderia sediminicola TaxID=458836 RepID=UPI0038BA36B8